MNFYYVDTAVEISELYCYNTEGDRNSVVGQATCRMEVTPVPTEDWERLGGLPWRSMSTYEYGI